MSIFKIKIVSQANTIISLLIFFILVYIFIPVRYYLLPKKPGPFSPMIFTVVSLLLLYFLFQKLARAYTEWTINETGVKIHWLTQFAFRHKADFSINWSEIDSYKRLWNLQYVTFKIYLKSGKTLIFYHDNLQAKDDFEKLIAAFTHMYGKKVDS